MRTTRVLGISAAVAACITTFIIACDMNVREAGYLNNMGGPYFPEQYALVIVSGEGKADPKGFEDKLGKVCGSNLAGMNFTAQMMDIKSLDEAVKKELTASGIDLSKLPVSILSRSKDTVLNVQSIEGIQTAEDVKALIASPKRLELHALLTNNANYCVATLLASADRAANQKAAAQIAKAIEEYQPRIPNQKIPVFTVDRSAAAEKYFLAEYGVPADNKEPVCLVVFGKGRVVNSVRIGEQITSEQVGRNFEFLGANASDCVPGAVYLPGTVSDLIMPWSQQIDRQIFLAIAKSGVIPELAPAVAELEGTPAEGGGESAPAVVPAAGSNTVGASSSAATSEQPVKAVTPVAAPAAPEGNPMLVKVVLGTVGLLAIVVIASWFIFLRRSSEQ